MELERQILDTLERMERNALLATKKVLTVDDVCTLTGFTKHHVYTLTSRREIPYYKPNGRLIYFDRDEIEAWMKRGRVDANDEAQEAAALAAYARK